MPAPVPFKRKRIMPLDLSENKAPQKKFKAPPTARPSVTNLQPPKKPFKPPPENWKPPKRTSNQGRRKRPKKEEEAPVFQMTTMVEFEAETYDQPADFQKPQRPDPDLIIARQRPARLDELVGKHAVVEQIRAWLGKFEKHVSGTPRCLMLVGPSGIGKSTAARLMFQESDYIIHEYSPDDQVETTKKEQYAILSDRGIEEVLYTLLIRNQVFGKFGLLLDGVTPMRNETLKHLVEVLSGLKYAQHFDKKIDRVWLAPVVITCDHGDLANLSTLARICEVVEFEPAPRDELTSFFQGVCDRESLEVPTALQQKVVKGCGGDIRRLLNTLHFLALGNLDGDTVTETIDVDTIFSDQHSMFSLLETLLNDHQSQSLEQLTDLIELHPISLAMLLQENAIRAHDQQGCDVQSKMATLESLEKTSEYISSLDCLNHAVYQQHNWELQEMATALSTWGVAKHFPREPSEQAVGSFEKSAYFGWKKKEDYRRKLMASFPQIQQRGENFIDWAHLVSERVAQHVSTKTKDETLIDYCKARHLDYKDLQNVWKCAHQGDKKMPNVRGKLSLRKLLQ